jgi:endonuclease/exonuclease/phosphatase (EEP) superfamily protein YafD
LVIIRLLLKTLRFLAFVASLLLLLLCACAAWLPPSWWTECLRAFTFHAGLLLLISGVLVCSSSLLLGRLGMGSFTLFLTCLIAALPIFSTVEYLSPWIPGYTIIHSKPKLTEAMPQIRFIQHNVLKARKNYDGVVKLLRKQDADFVALEEINLPGFVRLRTDPVLSKKYPSFAGGWQSGQCLLSRWPIQYSKTIIDKHFPILHVRVKTPKGLNLTIVVFHPPHPTTPFLMERQLALFKAVSDGRDSLFKGPLLVAGDLNDTPYNASYQNFLKKAQLHDPMKSFGLMTTWPSVLPPWLRIPIDHVFYSDDLKVKEQHLLPNTGSDHLPIYTVFYQPYPNPSFDNSYPQE